MPATFFFKKTIRERGRQGLIGTFIFTAIFAAIDSYLLHQPLQIGHVVGTWFAGLLTLIALLMTLWSVLLLISKDAWIIEVTEVHFNWQAPNNTDEESFSLPLSSIEKLCCITDTRQLTNTVYQLITTTERIILLKPNVSGVDIQQLLESLASQGIAVVEQTNNHHGARDG